MHEAVLRRGWRFLLLLSTSLVVVADSRIVPFGRSPHTYNATLTPSPSNEKSHTLSGTQSLSWSPLRTLTFSVSKSPTVARTASSSPSSPRTMSVSNSTGRTRSRKPPITPTDTLSPTVLKTYSATQTRPSLSQTSSFPSTMTRSGTNSTNLTLTDTVTPPPTSTRTQLLTATITSITFPPTPTKTHVATDTLTGTPVRTSTVSDTKTVSVSPSRSRSIESSATSTVTLSATFATRSLVVTMSRLSPSASSSAILTQTPELTSTRTLIAADCTGKLVRVSTVPSTLTEADIVRGGAKVTVVLPSPAQWSLLQSPPSINVTAKPLDVSWSNAGLSGWGSEQRFGFDATVAPAIAALRGGLASVTTVNGASLTFMLPAVAQYSLSMSETWTVSIFAPLCLPQDVSVQVTVSPSSTNALATAAYTAAFTASSLVALSTGLAGGFVGAAPDVFSIADLQGLTALATSQCAPAHWLQGAQTLRPFLDPIGTIVASAASSKVAIDSSEARGRAAVTLGSYLAVVVGFGFVHYAVANVVYFFLRSAAKRKTAESQPNAASSDEEESVFDEVVSPNRTGSPQQANATSAAAAAEEPLLASQASPSPARPQAPAVVTVPVPPPQDESRSEVDARRTWIRSQALVCFPSLTILVALLLQPGQATVVVPQLTTLFTNPSTAASSIGYVFFFCFVAVTLLGTLLLIPFFSRQTFVKFQRYTFLRTSSLPLQLCVPTGTWIPAENRDRMGACFASSRMFRRQGHVIPYVVSLAVVTLVAVPTWTTQQQCMAVYSAVAGIFAAFGCVVTLIRWPYTSRLASAFAVASYLLLALKAIFGAFHSSTSDSLDSTALLVCPVVDELLLTLTALRCLYGVFLMVFVKVIAPRWSDKRMQELLAAKAARRAKRSAARERRQRHPPLHDEDKEEGVELSLLHVPVPDVSAREDILLGEVYHRNASSHTLQRKPTDDDAQPTNPLLTQEGVQAAATSSSVKDAVALELIAEEKEEKRSDNVVVAPPRFDRMWERTPSEKAVAVVAPPPAKQPETAAVKKIKIDWSVLFAAEDDAPPPQPPPPPAAARVVNPIDPRKPSTTPADHQESTSTPTTNHGAEPKSDRGGAHVVGPFTDLREMEPRRPNPKYRAEGSRDTRTKQHHSLLNVKGATLLEQREESRQTLQTYWGTAFQQWNRSDSEDEVHEGGEGREAEGVRQPSDLGKPMPAPQQEDEPVVEFHPPFERPAARNPFDGDDPWHGGGGQAPHPDDAADDEEGDYGDEDDTRTHYDDDEL